MYTEQDHQIQLVEWFKIRYKCYENLCVHVNNNLFRYDSAAKKRMRTLKKMGLCTGCPDLLFLIPNENYAGLCLELKSAHGRLSDAQKKMIQTLRNVGYCAEVSFSFDESVQILNKYMRTVQTLNKN